MELARPTAFANPLLKDYVLDNTYDEMFSEDGLVRPHYAAVLEKFLNLPPEEMARRKRSVDLSFLTQGITFNVYGHGEGTEKIFPYDLLPRVITGAEWAHVEKGLTQRITALNLFLHDVYNEGKILNDGRDETYVSPALSGLQRAAHRTLHPAASQHAALAGA